MDMGDRIKAALAAAFPEHEPEPVAGLAASDDPRLAPRWRVYVEPWFVEVTPQRKGGAFWRVWTEDYGATEEADASAVTAAVDTLRKACSVGLDAVAAETSLCCWCGTPESRFPRETFGARAEAHVRVCPDSPWRALYTLLRRVAGAETLGGLVDEQVIAKTMIDVIDTGSTPDAKLLATFLEMTDEARAVKPLHGFGPVAASVRTSDMGSRSPRPVGFELCVANALRDEWNPIGGADIPTDEYDEYAPSVGYTYVAARAVVTSYEGLYVPPNERVASAVADLLMAREEWFGPGGRWVRGDVLAIARRIVARLDAFEGWQDSSGGSDDPVVAAVGGEGGILAADGQRTAQTDADVAARKRPTEVAVLAERLMSCEQWFGPGGQWKLDDMVPLATRILETLGTYHVAARTRGE